MDTINDTSRIESFSDNVFAVAMTLLAIEIVVPENSGHTNIELGTALLKLWPKYLVCINTFFTVLLM